MCVCVYFCAHSRTNRVKDEMRKRERRLINRERLSVLVEATRKVGEDEDRMTVEEVT